MTDRESWPGFRSVCPGHWPFWARRWASSPGSLTANLLALDQGFRVEQLGQGLINLAMEQCHWVSLGKGSSVRARSVLLHVNQTPVVAARTWIAKNGPRCDWRFWSGLGSRSLGTVLFSDPRVKRGAVHYKKLPSDSRWVRALLGEPMLKGLRERYLLDGWFVRGARFDCSPYNTPLWVFEVFLPTLQELTKDGLCE